jgi:hypothetical protein
MVLPICSRKYGMQFDFGPNPINNHSTNNCLICLSSY